MKIYVAVFLQMLYCMYAFALALHNVPTRKPMLMH
jgi:hypothetical protein